MRNTKYENGFTLTEAMMAVVVLGIAAAGVLLPFASGARVRAEGMHRTLAAKLASDLTEQIVNLSFANIVGNFDGYSEEEGEVANSQGTVFTDLNYSRFSRNVSCVYVNVPQESGAGPLKFIRVTVQVDYDGKQIVSVNRLISE